MADKLFSTLDSTTRRLNIDNQNITLSDTVGFIDKLPTTLIEAFKSTLSEASGADLVLHIVNSASSNYKNQIRAVEDILGELNYTGDLLLVFNKIDLLSNEQVDLIKKEFGTAILISALKGVGLEKLKRKVLKSLGFS